MKTILRLSQVLAAAAAATLLAACNPATSAGPVTAAKTAAAEIPQSLPISVEAVNQHARGFTTGAVMSTTHAYVFFDPQCPHCGHLWQSSKALHPKMKFTWIPVTLLNKASRTQAAALLKAPDGAQAMDQHEALLAQKRGGMSASSDVDPEMEAALAKNTQLLRSFGADSVPFIVAKHAQTGAVVSFAGALPPEQIAQKLGLEQTP